MDMVIIANFFIRKKERQRILLKIIRKRNLSGCLIVFLFFYKLVLRIQFFQIFLPGAL